MTKKQKKSKKTMTISDVIDVVLNHEIYKKMNVDLHDRGFWSLIQEGRYTADKLKFEFCKELADGEEQEYNIFINIEVQIDNKNIVITYFSYDLDKEKEFNELDIEVQLKTATEYADYVKLGVDLVKELSK